MKGADSSRSWAAAGSAALLALLLAAIPATAQDGQPPQEDESVLDWLSGGTPGTEPQQPTPAPTDAAPPAADEPAEPERVRPGQPSGPRAGGPTSAQDFADQLRAAMTLELQVREYENNTLGVEEHPEALQSFKKLRWDRLQHDNAEFNQTAGQMSLQPLDTPRPVAGVALSRDEISVLAALDRAYTDTRATRQLEQYIDLNKAFLKSADWMQRDRAVVLRDEIVQREVTFARLMQDAVKLTNGKGDEELIESMRASLHEVAPEVEGGGDDLAVLVMHNADLRAQVMDEVNAALIDSAAPLAPPRPDEEIRPRVVELQQQLLDLAELPPIIQEHEDLAAQIAEIDAQLESDLPQDKRLALVGQRTQRILRSNDLEVKWLSAVPDQATWDELVPLTQELIHRRLIDLGPNGVLYGARADALDAELADGISGTPNQWRFLDDQQQFMLALDGLQPDESNPLHSISLPDLWGQALMEEAQKAIAAEKQLLAQSTPQPVATKKFGMKSMNKKPPPKPKKKPQKKGGKKGGKKHKGGMNPY